MFVEKSKKEERKKNIKEYNSSRQYYFHNFCEIIKSTKKLVLFHLEIVFLIIKIYFNFIKKQVKRQNILYVTVLLLLLKSSLLHFRKRQLYRVLRCLSVENTLYTYSHI